MLQGLTGNILITGGSGTLGQAIVRTALEEHWDCTITIYSRSELRQALMRSKYPAVSYIVGDVRDYERLASAVAGRDVVIHAAAMKRIPECETQPGECYKTNVLGSMNVVRACIAGNVQRCVGISTDKACRAVTAYGASKLAMEKLFQAQTEGSTLFTLVRYGNVVASAGSIIPIWRKQAAVGAITLTHHGCTRFWMAPSEAVTCILWAASGYAGNGSMYVPKMPALSLVELAEIVAPGARIEEIGLRSCEKIHEDLIHEDEPAMDNEWFSQWTGSRASSFWITPKGELGCRYTSDTAPKLSKEAFTAMLAEAESYE